MPKFSVALEHWSREWMKISINRGFELRNFDAYQSSTALLLLLVRKGFIFIFLVGIYIREARGTNERKWRLSRNLRYLDRKHMNHGKNQKVNVGTFGPIHSAPLSVICPALSALVSSAVAAGCTGEAAVQNRSPPRTPLITELLHDFGSDLFY